MTPLDTKFNNSGYILRKKITHTVKSIKTQPAHLLDAEILFPLLTAIRKKFHVIIISTFGEISQSSHIHIITVDYSEL